MPHWSSASWLARYLLPPLLVAPTAASAQPAATGAVREIVRDGAPLVLKDGRIAHVGIYAVPFRPGTGDLDPDTKASLAQLIEGLATDCFLTAQAIGHVEPEATKGSEGLAAHRLARSRADRVQGAMVDRGLAQNAIASVWDWQFLVAEPRVTLWVFRLAQGEDCEGKRVAAPSMPATAALTTPLPPTTVPATRPAMPAAVSSPAASAPAATPAPVAVVPIAPSPPPATVLPGPGKAGTPPAVPALVAAVGPPAMAQAQPIWPVVEVPMSLPGSAASAAPVSVPQPALALLEASEAPPIMAAPLGPPTMMVPVAPPTPPGARPTLVSAPTMVGADGRVASMVFDLNSSYFARNQVQPLRTLLTSLPERGAFAIDLTVAVGGAETVETKAPDALRYNRWMAERRAARITDWLRDNAGGRKLEIRTLYRDNDPSRAVEVVVQPAA